MSGIREINVAPRGHSPRTPAGVDHGAVGRAVATLSLGAVQKLGQREAARRNMGLSEFELQYQIKISGKAGATMNWQTVVLSFETPFYYAPGNRDSDFDRPQFNYGPVITSGQPVMISACVRVWEVDPETEAVIGATVALGCCAPGTTAALSFGGDMHLSFQGYGGIFEDESDLGG